MRLPKRILSLSLACCLTASLFVAEACAAAGTVAANSGLHLRNSAGTDAGILATIPNGTQLDITGVTTDGWYQVTYNGVTGYVSDDYVTMSDAEKGTLSAVAEPVYGKVTAGPLNVRSTASTSGSKLKKLAAGTVVQILETLNGWYRIDGGYVSADYVQVISAAEALNLQKAADAAAAAAASSASAAAAPTSSNGAAVVAYAKQFLGYRYAYGGSSPSGFDCSGFTMYVYRHFGISLSHSASAQLNYGRSVSSLQPGDLVFFRQDSSTKRASHVGIYIGGGQFIHASSPSTGVIISSMNSHTARGYIGARRLV